jgi:hypothetical protein
MLINERMSVSTVLLLIFSIFNADSSLYRVCENFLLPPLPLFGKHSCVLKKTSHNPRSHTLYGNEHLEALPRSCIQEAEPHYLHSHAEHGNE